jgi:simple sugar transport system ATP-binding protein
MSAQRDEGVRTPVLEARALTRSFGNVTALDGADFDIYPGEVVALIGDNGAGKSTLVKALSGNLEVDTGEILFQGHPQVIGTPTEASALGIETVYQDLALAPHLDPVGNMFLGRETMRPGFLGHIGFMDNKSMKGEAQAAFDKLGATLRSLDAPVGSMSGGQRQAIAIARATVHGHRLIMLDEPTAALGVAQTRQVLDLVRRLADNGLGVLLISHNMNDVKEVSDRISALYLGRVAADIAASEVTTGQIVELITTGRSGEHGLAQSVAEKSA